MNKNSTSNIFIFFLVLFEFNVYMANDLIMPGMLKVVQEFNSNEDYIPLSLSLYLLGGILLQFILGPVSDKVGRRPTMIAGNIFFALCTLAIAAAPSMFYFLSAKLFQGMGLCFIGVCGYAAVQELFEEKKAVRVIAWMTTAAVTAPILGPILGGFLTQAFNWRWIFISTLVFSLISLWGIWKYMPETVEIKAKAFSHSNSPTQPALSRRSTFRPLLTSYRLLLTNRKLVLGGCLHGLLSAPTLCWIAISPIVLFKNANITSELYGVVQVPIFGCFIFGNFILRKLTYRNSLTQIIRTGFPVCFAGLVGLYVFSYFYPDSFWSLVLPLSFSSIGTGIISAPLTRQSLFSTTASKGIASAVHSLISTTVLIVTVSAIPLFFHGKNTDFGVFCLSYAIVTAVFLYSFVGPIDSEQLNLTQLKNL